MTDQERQLIQDLASRIQNAPAPQIDREADELIRRTIGSRPDALYILTQTVLIQEMALGQAKSQIEELKRQAAQMSSQSQSTFLGNPAGRDWGRENRLQQPGGYQGSNYQTGNPAPPPQPQYGPQYDPAPAGGRFSNFLQNAATTAAGVVAGEVAFSALGSLFGGHHGGSGFFGGGGSVSPVSETIINNYYDDDRDRGHSLESSLDRDDSGLSPDLEDRRFAASDDTDALAGDNDYSDDTSDALDDDSAYDDGSDSIDV